MPSATTTSPTPTICGLPRPLAGAMQAYADPLDVAKIREAYEPAVEAHGDRPAIHLLRRARARKRTLDAPGRS